MNWYRANNLLLVSIVVVEWNDSFDEVEIIKFEVIVDTFVDVVGFSIVLDDLLEYYLIVH